MSVFESKIEKLGNRQRKVLAALSRHGQWDGTGWVWENHSTTLTVLRSLERRGMVERYGADQRFIPSRDAQVYFTGSYTVR